MRSKASTGAVSFGFLYAPPVDELMVQLETAARSCASAAARPIEAEARGLGRRGPQPVARDASRAGAIAEPARARMHAISRASTTTVRLVPRPRAALDHLVADRAIDVGRGQHRQPRPERQPRARRPAPTRGSRATDRPAARPAARSRSPIGGIGQRRRWSSPASSSQSRGQIDPPLAGIGARCRARCWPAGRRCRGRSRGRACRWSSGSTPMTSAIITPTAPATWIAIGSSSSSVWPAPSPWRRARSRRDGRRPPGAECGIPLATSAKRVERQPAPVGSPASACVGQRARSGDAPALGSAGACASWPSVWPSVRSSHARHQA